VFVLNLVFFIAPADLVLSSPTPVCGTVMSSTLVVSETASRMEVDEIQASISICDSKELILGVLQSTALQVSLVGASMIEASSSMAEDSMAAAIIPGTVEPLAVAFDISSSSAIALPTTAAVVVTTEAAEAEATVKIAEEAAPGSIKPIGEITVSSDSPDTVTVSSGLKDVPDACSEHASREPQEKGSTAAADGTEDQPTSQSEQNRGQENIS
jgi:hypothetical protein